jgi:RNA polymerase sigma-70 factor (ECF subfamily)
MQDFDAVYRTHVHAVLRFAVRCVSNRALAEDLTAEAFLELYRHRESIDEERLPAWLLTIVRNRARDHWRKKAVEQKYAGVLAADGVTGEPCDLEKWLLESAELKPVHRTCIVLRYVYGMTRAEIASTTGLSEMQVKGYLQYALELLRKALVEGHGA